ncbi:class I SAM-dependent methyltransferase [Roseomonas sp. E05]|uniref:class I SAM-dependent methyltransferase n=1 Tax=Roseomonas sp. E05 TaxID=3046310 RepID=UPI0024BB5BE7|nr:class I SAM-dependent methyltransferase [Roseomonas sp. E05]MDJ0391154.1 class I SAM-dependent methyltransferase [Roseomonas sp. E05]
MQVNEAHVLGLYEANAGAVVPQYESVSPATLHLWLRDLLPGRPAAVLDVGAGTGRDAAWLASLGHEVVAAEPAAAMRREAARLHPDPRIRWTEDALPDLSGVLRCGLSFDFVLASAVWQHVHPSQRARAFRKMVSVLKPGGVLAVTLRHGPGTDGRGMHAVSAARNWAPSPGKRFLLMRQTIPSHRPGAIRHPRVPAIQAPDRIHTAKAADAEVRWWAAFAATGQG